MAALRCALRCLLPAAEPQGVRAGSRGTGPRRRRGGRHGQRREPPRVPRLHGFQPPRRGTGRARPRGRDAPLRPPHEAPPPAPRGALPPRAAPRPAGDHPPQRRERRHAAAPRVEGAAARAPAPRPAARREPLDEPLQLLLPAARARAVRRARRRPLLHLPHAHHRRGPGVARPGSVALAGTPAPARRRVGRRRWVGCVRSASVSPLRRRCCCWARSAWCSA